MVMVTKPVAVMAKVMVFKKPKIVTLRGTVAKLSLRALKGRGNPEGCEERGNLKRLLRSLRFFAMTQNWVFCNSL